MVDLFHIKAPFFRSEMPPALFTSRARSGKL